MRYATALLAATVALALVVAATAPAKSPRVLRVGKNGTYKTIQSAVNAAHSGDWILIAPGDYKERVLIRKSGLHLRGLSRSGVIVDGTKSGSACSSKAKDQVFNRGEKGNGIEVSKANAVWIENLTVCNFLGEGNQIWWNGGDGSGKIGMSSWYGSYLTATSTYFNRKRPQAAYGLFASNAKGPGRLTNSYASNMNDAAYYVGACHPCNATLDHVKGEFNTLGYSGTNSSGVTIQNSEFRQNFAGISTDSENNDDAPSPQNGSTFKNNFVHDNNNPNVPSKPEGLRIVGVGIIVTGGRHNVISGNRVENNGAWGILLAPFPDTRKPPKVAHCQGGVATKNSDGTMTCYFDDWANQVFSNRLKNNGFFGNPTNGDLGDISGENTPGNCWHDNVRTDGSAASAEPSDLQTAHTDCKAAGHGDDLGSELAAQALCNSELLAPCAADATHRYPRTTKVKVHKLPKLAGMKDPCKGAPANPWCPKRRATVAR
jgi:parallel beta helix pectate lyase-like protein